MPRSILTGQELFAQVRPLLGAGLEHALVAAYGDYVTRATDLALAGCGEGAAASRCASRA